MGRIHSRLAVYALAVLTCFVLFGADSAFAQVKGAGWYFNDSNQEIKFGLTASRFDFFNTVTGANVQGRVTGIDTASNPCGTVQAGFIGPHAGDPAARIHGVCDKGASCTFKMDVVDGGRPGKGNDFVCNVEVVGSDKGGAPVNETQVNFQPLSRGDITVKQ